MTRGGKKDEAVFDANEEVDEPEGVAVVEGQMEVVHPASSMIFHGTGIDYSFSLIPTAKGVKFDEDEASVSCRLEP